VTGFLLGVAVAFAVGFAVMVVVDDETRDALVRLLWALAAGPVMLGAMLGVAVLRLLGRRNPLVLRGRPMSGRTLERIAHRVENGKGGLIISTYMGAFVWVRRLRKDKP
jgi:hypothetical protein